MTHDELPETKQDRVDWVIRAPTNAEMRRRYDIWAEHYDGDVGSVEDYSAPSELAEMATRYLVPEARIIDAGAGTGLLGAALTERGFRHIVALDYSEKMLEIARSKGLYEDLLQCDLTQPTSLSADKADAVVTCGTTTQIPCDSLREYVRIARPGGKILFAAVRGTWEECGYAAIFLELEAAGRVRLIAKGEPFQMMPTTEPDFICEILVIEAL